MIIPDNIWRSYVVFPSEFRVLLKTLGIVQKDAHDHGHAEVEEDTDHDHDHARKRRATGHDITQVKGRFV